jgi:uncharacterized protein YeeX (DUF496 family)
MSRKFSVFVTTVVPAAALLAAACGPSPEVRARLAQADTISAQKDSLLQEVALQTRLLSDVAASIAAVQVKNLNVTGESPEAARRDSIVQTVRYAVARLDSTERRLRQSQARIRGLTHLSDSLRATLESTVTTLQGMIETQKVTIAAMTAQIDTLNVQNAGLTSENTALKDTVTSENTVFYVVGTKEQLKERGLVVEEGGSRVLFVLWRTGETLTPARELDANKFTAIDRRQTREIPLPYADGRYRIVSRQDLQYLETPRDERGKITGTGSLRIGSPSEFWKGSRFLIIVQEEPAAGQQGD